MKNYELIDEILDYYTFNKLKTHEQNILSDIVSDKK